MDEWVLCYGSNLYTRRLTARVPSARLIAAAILPEHRLCFHKVGQDKSAKADAYYTGDPDDRVYGAVFQVTREHLTVLDHFEGLGRGYERTRIVARSRSRPTALKAWVYRAQSGWIDPSLAPFHWYRDLVRAGLMEHDAPPDALAQVESVPAVTDPDQERARLHRQLLTDTPG
jgi:gamma-glutamylcyclotransferase (GGCT)/AIG2-like uncharacterized protein YtfP